MAGIPEMWRNQGNIYSRNTIVPPYGSEKQFNGKNPAKVLTSTVNKSELVSFCLPKNNLKPLDKQTQVSSDKSSSGAYSSNSKQDTIGRQQCNPVNIRLCNFLKQQPLPEKASPSLKGYKYVRDDFVALPYWKHADKDDPPVRTLFRAKKWIDSDEQGCKRVNCVVECEKIDSKYCSCSRKRIGVSVIRRNSVNQPCHDSVSSCFDQRKQENLKLFIGDKLVKKSEISGSCQFWNENNNGQVQYLNRNENCHQSHNPKRVSFNECDLETIKVATVQSSKCVYLKHSGGSFITSNNKVLLQNPSYCVPNVVHDRPSSTPTKLMAPNLRDVSGRTQRVKLCNLENSYKGKYPIDSQLLTEPGNVMGDHANNSEELRRKPEWAPCEGTLMLKDDSKLGDSISQSIKKKPKTVLDVLEVDTLAKANNILEKIACTLDQIKVLNQSTDIHESKKQIIKMEGENLKIGESVKDNKENLELAYNDDKKRKQNSMNIFSENEASTPSRNEGEKLDRPMTEKMCGDAHMITVDNVGLKKDHPSKDNGSDDLNTIPLKITKAVSAFKTVETSAVYSCKLYATQDLQGNHDAKKSHSINILGQVEVDQKKKIVNSLLEMSPDHKVSGETKRESFNPQNKAIPLDKAVDLVSPSSPKMKNLKKLLNEGIDQKKMTTVALQSVLKTAISPRTSSMKDSFEYSMKGDEDRSDSTRNKATANQSLPTTQSRIISLSQPKVRYIKALKTEYQNLLDKPILERLDRLIEPMEKLQSSTIANSKPPVHPSRNPSPRKTRTPVRNKIAEGDQKPNCTPTDACLKKTKLRPKTTPNKARDATVPQRGLTATIAAESSKNKMKNGNCAQDVVGRPVTVSADHQRQGSRVSSAPSHSGDRENGPSQLDGLAKVQVGSPLPTVHECEQSGRKRSQSSGEPVRLGLAASEGNAGERESYECLRNHSLIDNLEDEPLPSKRLRARSCIRRKEKIRPRRRRFTTCCFPLMPNPKYFLTDSFMSNNSEEPKTLTDSKKQYADASVNVSLTLKSENMDASVQKTEEVLVNSSQEGNNQIIFNVYQMTPENLASDRKDECSDRKGQLREEDGEATLRLEEDTSNATSQDHVEEGSCKSHVEILERPGMTDIRGYYPCSSPIYTTGGACGEGGPNRSQIEEPSPKRYVALPRRQDGRNLGELWGNGERLVLTTELPQYVPCQGHLGSLGKGRLPFPVRNVVCECCGRDGTSNVSQVFTSFSYAEPRTVSSAPSLEVSDSHRELCVECRRIMKTLPKLKIRKGRPLLRPLKESSSKIPHSREPVRCQGKCREESVHLSQPLGDLSLGVVRDWLRDSNVDLRRWSSELTVKVDVGTSVSGFHVANLYSGGTRINREAKCATDMEVDRKDVACSAKTSSVTVILEKKYFKLGQCMTKEVTPKKRSKVTPVRTLARVPNTRRRKILVMSGVYVCLFTFFGWVLLLPSYYIK